MSPLVLILALLGPTPSPAVTARYVTKSAIDTSAELRAILTDETGSGAACFANTPTLVTPILGVASATSVTLGSDPADLGDIRMENSDTICMETSPASSNDSCITFSSVEQWSFSGPINPSSSATGNYSSDPGDAGAMRLDNAESICWEASPTGTDACLHVNATEELSFAGSIVANNSPGTSASDPADTGSFRMDTGEQVCWEANPTGTDVCILTNSSEAITFSGISGMDLGSGTLTGTGAWTNTGTGTIGWNWVNGTDNTACSSQCTTAAVFGVNLAGGATAPVLVGPSDATADECLCAGAN